MSAASKVYRFRRAWLALAMSSAVCLPTQAFADHPLMPLTKVKLIVLQWIPTKGVYENWGAVGGEYVVSESGTLVLPLVGAMKVGNMDNGALASAISRQLKEKAGLVTQPETVVDVVEYAPIYVVGSVEKPGEYQYRPGLTVLRALAMGGGELRSGGGLATDQARAAATLRTLDEEEIRIKARIARLEAERSGAADLPEPAVVAGSPDAAMVADVYAKERTLFLARRKELERQSQALTELQQLLDLEITNLEKKSVDIDAGLASVQTELANVAQLVKKGILVTSRQSELERLAAGYRADRLDLVTSIMRARQQKTEARRNLDKLQDNMQTTVAADLQDQQARLGKLTVDRSLAQKELIAAVDAQSTTTDTPPTFRITRSRDNVQEDFDASVSTPLQPGDVVSVLGRNGPGREVSARTQDEIAGPAAGTIGQ